MGSMSPAIIEVDFHLMADVGHTYGLLDDISPPARCRQVSVCWQPTAR